MCMTLHLTRIICSCSYCSYCATMCRALWGRGCSKRVCHKCADCFDCASLRLCHGLCYGLCYGLCHGQLFALLHMLYHLLNTFIFVFVVCLLGSLCGYQHRVMCGWVRAHPAATTMALAKVDPAPPTPRPIGPLARRRDGSATWISVTTLGPGSGPGTLAAGPGSKWF